MGAKIVQATEENPIYSCDACGEVRHGLLTEVKFFSRDDLLDALGAEIDEEFTDFDTFLRAANLESVREQAECVLKTCPVCGCNEDDYDVEQISAAWACGFCGDLHYWQSDAEECPCPKQPSQEDDNKLFL